mmetsp:Transcript_8126/g.17631  ORF Transcript_8126/g.17631 Transcript_8126/m.17631 type:complete len:282 (+) Transcript_8126:345-1190(+)
MGKIRRRRRFAILSSATIAKAMSSPTDQPSSSLSTVFSCGTRWSSAKTCSTLCPTGDDDACPSGQYCYGGIPCDTTTTTSNTITEGGDGMEMETALERQHQLEREEVKRLADRREEDYVARFVCGKSYDEAAESCDDDAAAVAASPMDGVAAAVAAATTTTTSSSSAVYCPTGSSLQCPTDMQCYAAVSCPRLTHDEEPPLEQDISFGLELFKSFLVTEPILLNATDDNIRMVENGSGTARLAQEEWIHPRPSEWNSLFLESSSALLATVSTMLSPRHGLN